jgi:hypothetical protein
MMDREQLVKALVAAGVHPRAFQVPGVHTSDPMPIDFVFLRPGSDGGWETGNYERGQYTVFKRFDTETEAAADTYRYLTGHEPPS